MASFVTLGLARKARRLRDAEGLDWTSISSRLGHSPRALQAALRRLREVEAAREQPAPQHVDQVAA